MLAGKCIDTFNIWHTITVYWL